MIPAPQKQAAFEIGGIARMKLIVPSAEAHKVIVSGMTGNPDGRTKAPIQVRTNGNKAEISAYLHNAFVNQGLQAVLDSAYGDLVANRITHIALSGDGSPVTALTTDIDPGGAGFSPKPTANVSRTGQTVSADQTWTQADVSFSIRKIGLLTGALSTEVVNIIGGDGGAAPYDEPFTIDLTNIATWTLQIGIDVTATAS